MQRNYRGKSGKTSQENVSEKTAIELAASKSMQPYEMECAGTLFLTRTLLLCIGIFAGGLYLMKMRLYPLLLCAMFAALTSYRVPSASQPSPALQPPGGSAASTPSDGARRVHDPCIIREGAFYYVFATGQGIPISRSRDLRHWERAGRVFPFGLPASIAKEMPDSRGAWAPDISFCQGRFHLYYAVSRFGSNHSLIAHASNKTLDAASPDYKWVDEGKVFASDRGQNYNAIDPNIIHTPDGRAALVFGSFWSGVKLVFLDARTGRPDLFAPVVGLAQRPSPGAIEAPFLIHHGRYYYLFVSFDYCCRGMNSTYNIRVGRSASVTGPYADRDGRLMLAGGGSVVVTGAGREAGPGHCAVLQADKREEQAGRKDDAKQSRNQEAGRADAPNANVDYLVYHYYDRDAQGMPALQIRPLSWTPDGWPLAGAPLIDTPNAAPR